MVAQPPTDLLFPGFLTTPQVKSTDCFWTFPEVG